MPRRRFKVSSLTHQERMVLDNIQSGFISSQIAKNTGLKKHQLSATIDRIKEKMLSAGMAGDAGALKEMIQRNTADYRRRAKKSRLNPKLIEQLRDDVLSGIYRGLTLTQIAEELGRGLNINDVRAIVFAIKKDLASQRLVDKVNELDERIFQNTRNFLSQRRQMKNK